MDSPDASDLFRPLTELHTPDVRRSFFGSSEADHHAAVAALALTAPVPGDVLVAYDTARNVLLYAWFVYRFHHTAELQVLASVELALRRRLTIPDKQRSPRLGRLLKMALRRGLIRGDQFTYYREIVNAAQDPSLPTPSAYAETAVGLIRDQRNRLMHGSDMLYPHGTFVVFRTCRDLIDQLFTNEAVLRSDDAEELWEAGWSQEAFKHVLAQPGFPALVALARAMNLLRFAHAATVEFKDGTAGDVTGQTPAKRRQVMNTFFVSNAILHEVVTGVIPALGQHFAEHRSFSRLGSFRRNPAWRALIERNYDRLRDQATFHFDADVIGGRLGRLGNEFLPFISACGHMLGARYYDLADITATQALLDEQSDEPVDAQLRRIVSDSADLGQEFMKAATKFLDDVLEDLKPEVRPWHGEDQGPPLDIQVAD